MSYKEDLDWIRSNLLKHGTIAVHKDKYSLTVEEMGNWWVLSVVPVTETKISGTSTGSTTKEGTSTGRLNCSQPNLSS